MKDLTGQRFLEPMNSANKDFMTVDGKVYGLSISSRAGASMVQVIAPLTNRGTPSVSGMLPALAPGRSRDAGDR